jgi:hypothetical protein
MHLLLERIFLGETYTVGRLFIDGKYFCDTIEDKVRDLDNEGKVYGKTAIPYGTYRIAMDVVSPRFANHNQYRHIGGKLPRLLDVPHFDGILIHIGTTAEDSSGCILVGQNLAKGKVLNSTITFNNLYTTLLRAKAKGEEIKITIKL